MPTLLTAGASNRYVYVYRKQDGTPYYVGKGTGHRMRTHIRNAKKDRPAQTYVEKYTKHLINAGCEPIIEKIVDEVDDEFALFVEQEFIRKYGRRDIGTGILTNCTDGGDSVIGVSAEKRQKMIANLQTGVAYRFQKGQTPHNFGKPSDPAAVEKMRRTKTGKKQSPEHIEKRRARLLEIRHRFGIPHTEETKLRISETKKGCAAPPGTFDKWVCTCCGKAGVSVGAAKRWHFENCKHKENT